MTSSRPWTTSRAPRPAGDPFPTTRVLTADGIISLMGCLMGNPFILAVYTGHPGWKAIAGRIGYSAATGVMVILLSWFGVVALMMSLVPVVAISPILLYIGMLIGAQAFQETPKSHAPAIVLALVPHVAAWGKLQIDNALSAAGTSVAAVGVEKLGQSGILYEGLSVLGGGAILSSLILASVAVFVIERQFLRAAAFASAGAVLTFFGFMHGQQIGLAQRPAVALSYLLACGVLACCARRAPSVSKPSRVDEAPGAKPRPSRCSRWPWASYASWLAAQVRCPPRRRSPAAQGRERKRSPLSSQREGT